ncbi:MAG: ammonium transporter [Acidimicrobiia bacterium]
MLRPLFAVLIVAALLLPALFRRQRRRAGLRAGALSPRFHRRLLATMAISALLLVVGLAGVAFASNGDASGTTTGTSKSEISTVTPAGKSTDETVQNIRSVQAHDHQAINYTWLMIGGVLVLFMQAGFALVETGFTRAKNGAHTMMMNLVIFALGVVGWFVCGYALMFGSVSNSTLGITALGSGLKLGDWQVLSHTGFFLGGHAYDVGIMSFFFFQLVFMDATATIPTGAMAERFNFKGFVFWGLFASMILYPLYGNWVWGGGFLSQLGTLGPKWGHGALDFAGSGVVHAMGGVAAFWGAKILGPRIGKFDKDGNPRAIPGHHLPMAFLGTMILLVGWMGFNGASTFASTDFRFTVVIVNTILAAAFGCLTTMFVMWFKYGKPDPSMTCNGLLAGLVAITAPCAFVAPWGAAVIGIVAGVLVVLTVVFMDHKARVDDPVGAVAVHGANGLWGVLALGLFADGKYGDGFNGVAGGVKGLFYGDGGQFMAQLTSAVVLVVWCSIACVIFFTILKKAGILRSTVEAEIAGLDIPEMGALAYPDFLEAQGSVFQTTDGASFVDLVPADAASLREEVGAK